LLNWNDEPAAKQKILTQCLGLRVRDLRVWQLVQMVEKEAVRIC